MHCVHVGGFGILWTAWGRGEKSLVTYVKIQTSCLGSTVVIPPFN